LGQVVADIQAIRNNLPQGDYAEAYLDQCRAEVQNGNLENMWALLYATAAVAYFQGQVVGQSPRADTLETGLRLGWLS
jgi:hypothetical protein